MLNAQVRPSRDLRNNYADIVKSLKQHDHVIITNNGVGESVLISIEDYVKYEEFLHHRFIFDELQKSKENSKSADFKTKTADAVFSKIDKKLESRGL